MLNDTSDATRLADLSDEDLAVRVQQGCVKSYEQIDQRYRARLVHLLRRKTRSEADAEDAAQQALFTAYHKIDQFDSTRRFSSWLFTIAVRKAVDLGRKQRPADGGDSTIALADAREGPMQRAIRTEEAAGVWKTADAVLNPQQWTVLWMAYGEEQSPAEIAKALNLSRVNVRVLLHRARKTLAQALTQTQDEPTGSAIAAAVEGA